jgi:hypothetical protein
MHQAIQTKPTNRINALESTYLTLVDIRELLVETNDLLRQQQGLKPAQRNRITARPEAKKKRTIWSYFQKNVPPNE